MASRRDFIKTTGIASIGVTSTLSALLSACSDSDEQIDLLTLTPFQFHLFRPGDLLDLEFTFLGTVPNRKKFSRVRFLKPSGKGSPYMIVRIPQQHISELFFYLTQDDANTAVDEYNVDFVSKIKDTVAKSFVSGFSFLVFKIDFDKIDKKFRFTSDNLLNWNTGYLELMSGTDTPTPVTNVSYPLVKVDYFPFQKGNVPITTLELPYKLYLSPAAGKFIFSSNQLRHSGNIVELWSNQINGPSVKSNPPSFKVIGYEPNNGDYAGSEKYLPTETDRRQLSDQFLRSGENHVAETLDFRISSLGAITKIRYNEEESNRTAGDIIEWKQDINLGRDNYVKVVTLGVLMPFGFKCKHIRIGERQIKNGVSFVEYKEFIEPLEFEKSYFVVQDGNNANIPGAPAQSIEKEDKLTTQHLRNTPFKSIRISTKISPPIIPVDVLTNEIIVGNIADPRITSDPSPVAAGRPCAFWPKIKDSVKAGSSPIEELLHFNYVGVDWNDTEIYFKSPFIFVRDILFTGVVDGANKGLAHVIEDYAKAQNKVRREINIASQKISYYKTKFARDIGSAIDTKVSALETEVIEFLAFQGEKFINEFPYYPQLEAAYVYLPVIQEIIKDPRGTIIKYADVYLEKGIEKVNDNVEGILLDIQQETRDATGNFVSFVKGQVDNVFNNVADKLAGIVKPEMVIQAISLYENAYGTYRDCAEIAGQVKRLKEQLNSRRVIDEIFKEAKLLGALELKKLLNDNLKLDELPIAEFRELYDELKSLKQIEITYQWSGAKEIFKTFPAPGEAAIVRFINHNNNNANTDISVEFAQIINVKDPSQSTYRSETKLNNFGIAVEIGTPLITLYFDHISYVSATNQKSDVDVAINKVAFAGLLDLVKQLQESLGTFGKGLSFDVSSDKILVGYQFEVPTISTGAFNLSNIKLGFDFNLHFKNKPIDFRFRFSERESPFLLSVGIFGGRGYFGIRVSSRGIEEIEALLEFGGYLGIDVGIARGCVYLFAGIFYRNARGTTDLYGYLVCGGILNVLGILEMSMTFYMGLESHGNEGALMGTASVTVKIRLGFFKIEKTASMTKRITSSGGAENNVFKLFSATTDESETSRLLRLSEKDDSFFFDNCDTAANDPVYVADDAMLFYSLDHDQLISEYSSAFN